MKCYYTPGGQSCIIRKDRCREWEFYHIIVQVLSCSHNVHMEDSYTNVGLPKILMITKLIQIKLLSPKTSLQLCLLKITKLQLKLNFSGHAKFSQTWFYLLVANTLRLSNHVSFFSHRHPLLSKSKDCTYLSTDDGIIWSSGAASIKDCQVLVDEGITNPKSKNHSRKSFMS